MPSAGEWLLRKTKRKQRHVVRALRAAYAESSTIDLERAARVAARLTTDCAERVSADDVRVYFSDRRYREQHRIASGKEARRHVKDEHEVAQLQGLWERFNGK